MPFTAWKHTERDRQRDSTKIQDIQECVSFSPEFYRNRTKIQDFSFLADRMPAEAYCYDRRCFVFFHQNFTAMGPKFRTFEKKIEIFFHIRIAFYINMGLNQPNRYPIDPTKLIKRIHTTFIRLFTASIDDIESK